MSHRRLTGFADSVFIVYMPVTANRRVNGLRCVRLHRTVNDGQIAAGNLLIREHFIKQRLKEEKGQGGAYYCSLPSFRDSYRLVTRMLERSGQSAYLMLCSLTDGKGHPLEKPEKLELLSEELQNTIQHCLRKGDSFTKYSPSQYLVLLIGTNKENCGLIFDRIRKYFAREHRSWNKYVEFYVSSVAEVDNLDTPIQFRNDDSGWK